MKRLLNRIDKIIPRYAWLPLIIMFSFNALTYWGTRLISTDLPHRDMGTALDARIPFAPWAISVYLLAYVVWAANYILIARESPRAIRRVALANCVSKVFCIACFILMPTTMPRPDASGGGVWLWLVRLIYALDPSDNLFPSIHCLENWLGWRGMFGCGSIPRRAKALSFIAGLMVFASTVLVHQHYLVDIAGGMLAAEIGLAVSNLFFRRGAGTKAEN